MITKLKYLSLCVIHVNIGPFRDWSKSMGGAVFSLNFSSAGEGRFMAGKAQDMCQRHTLIGGEGGSRVRDMARPLLRNFGAKFSERSFPLF